MMLAKTAVNRNQATLGNAMVGIFGLIEDVVTALITCKSCNGLPRTVYRIEPVLAYLVIKVMKENFKPLEFEKQLL